MVTLSTLAAGISSPTNTRLSELYITELNDDDRPAVGVDNLPIYKKFQYFPDSVQDNKSVNYQTKDVPGGSLPLYQYVNSGAHTVSFTAYFTTDVDHLISGTLSGDDRGAGGELNQIVAAPRYLTTRNRNVRSMVDQTRERFRASGVMGRNVYIPGALMWLRRFLLPRYGNRSEIGIPLTKAPHKLLLNFTGSEISLLGGADGWSMPGSGLNCIMLQCDITIQAFFPSGNMRTATVALSFAETPQRVGTVRFPSATGLDEMAQELYWLSTSNASRTGGGGF